MARIIYVPLELGLIKNGEFLHQINEELLKLQSDLVRYVEKFGDKVDKAKSKMSISLNFAIDPEDPTTCHIDGQITVTRPARPKMITSATPNIGQDDQPYLFVKGLNQSDEPGQRKFEVGTQKVDTSTGEVLEGDNSGQPG